MRLDSDRVQTVLAAALGVRGADRAAVLERECSADGLLRERVEELLRAHDRPEPAGPGPFGEDGGETIASAAGDGLRSGPTIDLGSGDPGSAAGVASEVHPARVIPRVDGYEILGELGRGGMGVVYKARQVGLGRPCALKMILGGAHARPESAARFLAEARSIAHLRHPNIVQIYHIGEADNLPFFELEYIEGGSLDAQLDGTPWKARRAARLVEQVAGAMAEAHRSGIVHRDLKPANILLMADGSPRVTDFGLAKSLGDESGLTATDSILGSPSYMAPEQAAGRTREIGPPADLYALGATLYDLLTGRPPFRGASILETLDQVKHADPVAPSKLVPGLPRDLETIALKCLRKEPERRYASAEALAEDLRRFLAGEPIVARPVPAWERAWRWCRRHPAPAALTAAVVLVAGLGLAGILWQWREAVRARDLASKLAVAEAKALRETESTLVDMYTTAGIVAGDQGDRARAALWFANAARRALADPDRAASNAIRARTWGRGLPRPVHAIVAEGPWMAGLAPHPGGRHLITEVVLDASKRDHRVTLWDLDLERPSPFPGGSTTATAAAWSPDGTRLAPTPGDGDVLLARFPADGRSTRIPFPGRVGLLKFSADGRRLAVAGGKIARVWDVGAGRFETPELIHPAQVTSMAFDADGAFLATGCADQKARLFAASGDDREPLWAPVPHLHDPAGTPWYPVFVGPPVFVDEGRLIVTQGGNSTLSWRSAGTGAEVRSVRFPDYQRGIASVEPSPDGRLLAVVGVMRPHLKLIDAADGGRAGPDLSHENTIFAAAWSPDGRAIASTSTDNTARLWSVPGGDPLGRPIDLHRPVSLVAFGAGGRLLVTQDRDLVRVWALSDSGPPTARVAIDGHQSFAALSPDGRFALPSGMSFGGTVELRSTAAIEVETGRAVGPTFRPGGQIVDAAFSPDGRSIAVAGAAEGRSKGKNEVVVWDRASGRELWRSTLPSDPRSLAYDGEGRRLAGLCGGGEILVFDAEAGYEVRRWRAHDAEPAHHWVNNGEVRFTPDGRGLLSWGMGNDARAWDPETGRSLYPPIRHRDKCHDLQFSPDGRSMVLASYDGSVRVAEVATGAILAELPRHPDLVYSGSFSPDGRRVVTACRDSAVRVWDWLAGSLACPPFEHPRETVAAAFTPDGRWVVSTSINGTARAWDWRTGKPVTPPLAVGGEPLSLVLTPDGKRAIVGGGQAAIALLDLGDLSAVDTDPTTLRDRAELLSGMRLHPGGGTVNLSADEWLDRWRALRRP